MKRHLTLICGMLLMLAMLLPAPLSAWAEETLKTDKTVYSEGDDIKITAVGEGNDWVGIWLRTDTVGNEPAIRWYYVAKEGNTSGAEKSIFTAERKASNRSDLLDIPVGEYMICLCSDDSYNVVARLDITVTESTAVVDHKTLKTDKSVYTEGEPVLVTATGDKGDWVGLYKKGESFEDVVSIRWYYVAKEGNVSGDTKNIFNSEYVYRKDLADMPAGEYTLYLLADGGYDILSQVDITVTAKEPAKEDENDENQESQPPVTEKTLKTDKTVYTEGEPIFTTATGEGKDWVGLYLRTDTLKDDQAIRWYYVASDGNTSGSEKNLRTAEGTNSSRAAYADVPAGEYTVYLCENDKWTVLAKTDITVTKPDVTQPTDPGTSDKPATPPKTGVNDHITAFAVLAVAATFGALLLLSGRMRVRK